MALEVGILGLPNVGKSTLFRALTKVQVEAANYPFCTIDPNIGIVQIRDPRMIRLTELVSPEKIIPATLQIVDIAGLVKGASHGEGLGNQFLSHIRQVDAVAHVVRCFEDENVVHVDGRLDPVGDVQVPRDARKCGRIQQSMAEYRAGGWNEAEMYTGPGGSFPRKR